MDFELQECFGPPARPADLSDWLAIGPTLGPLATHPFSAADWAHAGTTLALWLAVPLIIGMWRFARRDVD